MSYSLAEYAHSNRNKQFTTTPLSPGMGIVQKNQQKNRETGGWGGQGHHPIGKYFLTTFKSMQSGGIWQHNFKAVFIILIITLFFYSKIGQCFETVWLEPDLYTPLQ